MVYDYDMIIMSLNLWHNKGFLQVLLVIIFMTPEVVNKW